MSTIVNAATDIRGFSVDIADEHPQELPSPANPKARGLDGVTLTAPGWRGKRCQQAATK